MREELRDEIVMKNTMLYKLSTDKFLLTTSPLSVSNLDEIQIETGSRPQIIEELNSVQLFFLSNYEQNTSKNSEMIKLIDLQANGDVSRNINLISKNVKYKKFDMSNLKKERDVTEYQRLELIDRLLTWERNYLLSLNEYNRNLKQIPIRVTTDINGNIFTGTDICTPKLQSLQSNLSILFSDIYRKEVECIYSVEDYQRLIGRRSFQNDQFEMTQNYLDVETVGLNLGKHYDWPSGNIYYQYDYDSKLNLYRMNSIEKSTGHMTRIHYGVEMEDLMNQVSLDAFGTFFMNALMTYTAPKFTINKEIENSKKKNLEYVLPELNNSGFHIIEV